MGYLGYWGYFPSYALGALMAAQFYEAALETLPTLSADFARGGISAWGTWLKTHIHDQASLVSSEELIKRATGKPLGVEAYL